MRPPDRICTECQPEVRFHNGVGAEQHQREVHGWITVFQRPSGRIKLVPIMSHPAIKAQA